VNVPELWTLKLTGSTAIADRMPSTLERVRSVGGVSVRIVVIFPVNPLILGRLKRLGGNLCGVHIPRKGNGVIKITLCLG